MRKSPTYRQAGSKNGLITRATIDKAADRLAKQSCHYGIALAKDGNSRPTMRRPLSKYWSLRNAGLCLGECNQIIDLVLFSFAGATLAITSTDRRCNTEIS